MSIRLSLVSAIFILIFVSMVSAGFGYQNPSIPKITTPTPTVVAFNNNTGSVNSSEFADIWVTNEGDMDNVADLFPTLSGSFLNLPGTNANQNIDISPFNLTASWFKGKFNWTSADDWNIFDGSTLDFNESKLSIIYYNATQANIISGTIDGGTLADTQHKDGNYDGVTFNFSEASGSPALDLRINFTGVESFNHGVMRFKTSSLAGDFPIVQMWNYNTNNWEDYPPVAETESFATMTQPVFNSVNYLQNGVAQMRIYKSSNGNTNNHYYVDWIAISKGYGTPSGQEIDPFSLHRDGSIQPTGNFDWNNFNITNIDYIQSSTLNVTGTSFINQILADTGNITLGGTGGTHNEQVRFNFDEFANHIILDSPTGANNLRVNFNLINFRGTSPGFTMTETDESNHEYFHGLTETIYTLQDSTDGETFISIDGTSSKWGHSGGTSTIYGQTVTLEESGGQTLQIDLDESDIEFIPSTGQIDIIGNVNATGHLSGSQLDITRTGFMDTAATVEGHTIFTPIQIIVSDLDEPFYGKIALQSDGGIGGLAFGGGEWIITGNEETGDTNFYAKLGGTMNFWAPFGGGMNLKIDSVDEYVFDDTTADFKNNDLKVGGTKINMINIPTGDATATAMFVCWDTDGLLFLNETGCRA